MTRFSIVPMPVAPFFPDFRIAGNRSRPFMSVMAGCRDGPSQAGVTRPSLCLARPTPLPFPLLMAATLMALPEKWVDVRVCPAG